MNKNTNTDYSITLTQDIKTYLSYLSSCVEDIESIWLFGSRANSTYHEHSDWDFFVFGSEKTFESIRLNTRLHRKDVDLLVVDRYRRFSNPYGHIKKTGCLDDWEWVQDSATLARYLGTHCEIFDPEGDGFVGGRSPFKEKELSAVRISI